MAKRGATFLNIISAFNSKGIGDAQKGFDSLGSKVGKFAKVAAAAMAAAAAAAVAYAGKLAIDGVKAAIEDEKAQAKLAATLKNVTNATDKQIASVEEHINKLSLATGVADDQLRPAYENLVRATGDMDSAQKNLNLAMDISAGTGKGLETVSLALGKAFTGNIGALTRLGIPLDANAVKSKDLNAILSQLTDTFGGQAAVAADTFEGKMARLQVAFDEAKETVGAYILDAITPLVEQLVEKIIPAITEFAESLGKKLKPVFETLAPIFKGFVDNLMNMGDAGSTAKGFFDQVSEGVQWLIGYFKDFVPILQDFWKQIEDNILPALSDLWKTFQNNLLPAIKSFLEFIKPALLFFANIIKNAVIGALEGAIQFIKGFIKVLSGILDFITGIFTGDWSRAWEGIKRIFTGLWDALIGIVKFAWNVGILKAFSLGWQALKGLVTKGWEAVKKLFANGISGIVNWFKNLPKTFVETATAMRSKLLEIGKNIIQGLINGMKNAIPLIIESIKNIGTSIVDGVKNFFGISSPSKLMEQFGVWISEGLQNGIAKGFDDKKFKETLGKWLEKAKSELAKAKEIFETFKNEVQTAIMGALDFGAAWQKLQEERAAAAESGETLGKTFLDALQEQADEAIAFAQKVAQLIEMGLSKEALQQVLAAGTKAGSEIADELIAGGSGAIKKTNELVNSTKKAAEKVGQFAAESYFGAGVKTAKKMVEGFKDLIKKGGKGYKELMAEMDALAKALERTIKLNVKLNTSGVTTTSGITNPIAPSMGRTSAPAINITVNGAIDPESTARQIQNILTRSTLRAGAY